MTMKTIGMAMSLSAVALGVLALAGCFGKASPVKDGAIALRDIEPIVPPAPVKGTAGPPPDKRGVRRPEPEPEPEPAVRTHLVRRGETLSGLARRYYGNAGKWRHIYEANRDKLKKPSGLQAGMTIVIPD
jgi:nucleoid-associated protein YgaU